MTTNESFFFTFVTPEKEILNNEEVQEILCPSEKGQLNILPKHAPLIALLSPGVLSFKKQEKWQKMAVSWGYLEVYPNGVRVLAETAETGLEISKVQAEKNLKTLYEQLKNPFLTPQESREIRAKMEAEQTRMDFAKK